jgi:hypothetical protein
MKTILLLTGLLLSVAGVAANPAANPSDSRSHRDAQARYQAERAACLKGDAIQDRATCLKEAGAALAEAKRQPAQPQPAPTAADYDANALARCDRRPEQERADCRRMVRGSGSRSGSVAEGAVVRELVTTSAAPAASAASAH